MPEENKKGTSLTAILTIAVIAVIIVAVAVPIVNARSEAQSLSILKSDCATSNMLVKEAVDIYKARIKAMTWNGKTADYATVGDVLVENDIYGADESDFYSRTIGGKTYEMVYDNGNITISGEGYSSKGEPINENTSIAGLAEGTVESGSYGGTSSVKSGSYGGTSKTNTCTYTYSDGSVCGAPCNHHKGLCDRHFNELNDTYNSLIEGGWDAIFDN